MGKHDSIFIAGDFIARQDIGIQYIGGTHTHVEQSATSNQPSAFRVTEDVDYEEMTPRENKPQAEHFPFVMADKLAELQLYTLPEFEKKYREAAGKEAPAFAKFLKQYRSLGILDFEDLDMKQIFAELKAFFPAEIKYKYRNFATYFSL